MKFKSTKKVAEIILEGVEVRLDVVDGSLKGVYLRNAKGNRVRIRHRDYSNIAVEVPAPPEMVKKYRLHGTAIGLLVDKTFDHKHEAEDEQCLLDRKVSDSHQLALVIEEVEVPADGLVTKVDDDIPF